MRHQRFRVRIVLAVTAAFFFCQKSPSPNWIASAEYEAISLANFQQAGTYLKKGIYENCSVEKSFGGDAIIIADIDETLVSTKEFQHSVQSSAFSIEKWNRWILEKKGEAMPGAVSFANYAAKKAKIYYVTNRQCLASGGDPCPQKKATMGMLVSLGFPGVSDETVLLRFEKPEWTDDKSLRRQYLAQSHKIIMILGDDLGDFLPLVREKSLAQKKDELRQKDYWGKCWFLFPNPVYGSWTSAQ